MPSPQTLTRTITLVALAVVIAAGSTFSQEFTLWGNLEPGQYGVGFETLEQYDRSRTFRSPTDYFGNPQDGQTARPIQACIWYPAQASDGQLPMVYGEYAFPYPSDGEFFNLASAMHNRELRTVGMFLRGNANMLKAMDLTLMGVRDAAWADGSFPVIVFHPGFRGAYCQNVVLCEYLASHGFVVITTHPLGTTVNDAAADLRDLETSVRDKEFAVSLLTQRPGADLSRIGTLGFATGGLGALIHQMRNPGIAAVAIMQGDFAPDAASDQGLVNPSMDPLAAGRPLLHIHVGSTPEDFHDYIDTLQYAHHHLIQLDGPTALDMTSYGLLALTVRDSTGPPPAVTRNTYEAACTALNSFFKAHVDGNEKADDPEHGPKFIQSTMDRFSKMENPPTVSHRPGDPVPPTAVQFTRIVRENGPDVAAELVEKFDLCNPEHPILPGPNFTGLGYEYLQSGRTEPALKVFKMGVTAYPNSANAWDSYGEANSANGELHQAVTCYEKALSLLDSDPRITPGLRDAINTNAPQIIARLKERIAEQDANQ
ncbi:MAG: dienelactone hydrolase family protein [candidate division Zixibacteria bacterium]|nr:dienelactone hydrolase family protein [candidate division Zixibacteria bacterium]MDH3937088.1 dienelactone hydrolase family protein [candidate division Zixibacteria bacterium]MDH4033852.1 dienelactone hydrolase family protein [candidate division Zixibacteria bacterium]